jgi:hypothetical protein
VSAGPDLGDAGVGGLYSSANMGRGHDRGYDCGQAAEPSHGETWQPIAKDDKNGDKSAKEIIELIAAALH